MDQNSPLVVGGDVEVPPMIPWESISPSIQAAVTPSANPTSVQTPYIPAATSSTSPSESSAASIDSLGLSSKNRGAIIGGVIGGVAGLGITLVLVLFLLGTRKKAKKQRAAENKNRATIEERSYTGLNEAFAGVPFRRSGQSQDVKLLRSLQSPSPVYSPTTPGNLGAHERSMSRSPSPYLITPEASLRMVPSDPALLHSFIDGTPPRSLNRSLSARESDRSFRYSRDLPGTPARSLSDRVTSRFSIKVDSSRFSTVDEVSLSSPKRAGDSIRTTSAHDTSKPSTPNLPVSPNSSTPLTPQFPFHYGTTRDTLDTMGFPVGSDSDSEPPRSPYTDLPLVSPIPRSPLHKQKGVLERVARGDVTTTQPSPLSNIALLALARQSSDSSHSLYTPPSPEPSSPQQHKRTPTTASQRIVNEMQFSRESPVLGMRGPPVKISPSTQNFPPQVQGNKKLGAGLGRKASTKSALSVSSAYSEDIPSNKVDRHTVWPKI
ncbi:hypothetical protein GLAREA_11560 [Glarea lozoyensis ATCC 20868]|uniref:Uncharacterized protein n=1 Tax=Glarea lozoyensis (strain ATCC 20868 / MF5171) TaxID=1116229 RepID=S3CI86_GLAL2|nr:uncharacterized protein GLAREA_11560 [Glarea lozoyensis ATCC 20868]EPE24979.1 hypothetical protein GLAREA_11560 [Glarea lozoyensis ATCC 20868]